MLQSLSLPIGILEIKTAISWGLLQALGILVGERHLEQLVLAHNSLGEGEWGATVVGKGRK